MPVDSQPAKQISGSIETTIRLGWHMAQVYHTLPIPESYEMKHPESLPDNLPGIRDLGMYQRGKTLLAEIQRGVQILKRTYHFELLSEKALKKLIDKESYAQTREVLLDLHQELHSALAVEDPRFAKAYDLGRMLADTVLLSNPADRSTLLYEFSRGRLGNAYQWLDDLHSLLPEYASFAVSGSLKVWEKLIDENMGVVPTDASSQARFHQALHDQGENWRQLLCGEKPGKDFLKAESYNAVGNRVTNHFLSLVFGFIRGWWYAIALFAVIVGGVVFLIVQYTPQGQTKVIAFIATTATTIGITWKTVAATLGQVAKAAEGPLWEAEVNEAIVIATTHLPVFKERQRNSSKALNAFPGETSV